MTSEIAKWVKNKLIIISYLCFLICFNNCSKETIYEEFEQPTTEILSIEKISKSDYEIKLHINKGVGAILKEKYLIIDDITDLNKSFTQELQLENEEKESELSVVVKLTDKHDYRIQSVLQSEKNEYKGNTMYLYLSEKYQTNGFIDVEFPYLGEFFKDIPNNIGYISKLNEGVSLHFYYKWLPGKPVPVTVKVDGITLLKDSLSFDYWIYDARYQMYFVSVNVTFKDISTGDHAVHITLDNKEYVMREKVRILEGNVTYSNFVSAPQNWLTNVPYVNMPFFSSDKLLYFLTDTEDAINYFYKIISFNLKDKSWHQNGTIVFTEDRCYFCGSNTQIGENLYALASRDSFYYETGEVWPKLKKVLDIWKYNLKNNSFTKETKYPGEGLYYPLFFSDNENIYMGGGIIDGYIDKNRADFWCYNLNTKKWNRKNDTPISVRTNSLFIHNTIYIFTGYRELWTYSPLSDNWQKISTIKGGSYYRDNSSLLYLNGDLYVVGGTSIPGANVYYEDVWKYNIQANSWTLKTFFDLGYYRYPAFVFNNKIYSTDHNIFDTYKFAEIQ